MGRRKAASVGIYAAGRGVPQDFVASHMWMTLAAARLTGATQHGALKFRDTMASAMTSGKIAEAQRPPRGE